jgi:hypothetical protein
VTSEFIDIGQAFFTFAKPHVQRHPITNPAIWQETFVSAVLRSIADDNDEADGNDGQPLLGLRKLDPLPTRQVEARFLEAARAEFWKG